MANPQCENGYTKISNEVMEAFSKTNIGGGKRQIVDFIIRKTYGFQKKRDKISFSQFSIGTNLSIRDVCRCINQLVNMKIIIKIQDDQGNIYSFNKNYDQWTELTIVKNDNGQNVSLATDNFGNNPLSKMTDTKETIQKIIQKKDFFLKGIKKGNEYVPDFKPPQKMKMGGAYRNKGQEFGAMVIRLASRFNDLYKEKFGEEYKGGSFSVDPIASQVSIWKKQGMEEKEFVEMVESFFKSKKAKELTITLNACFSDHSIMTWRQRNKKEKMVIY